MVEMKLGSENDEINLAFQKITRYQYDVFISYSKKNERYAEKLYKILRENDFTAFFAPQSLKDNELLRYNRWVNPLNQGMQHSCNFIALMSSTYLASSWCLLELLGFRNLQKGNSQRNMNIYAIEEVSDVILDEFKSTFLTSHVNNFDEFLKYFVNIMGESTLKKGDLLQPLTPRTFVPLPLREKYGLTAPWGKDSQTPGGHPAGPSYIEYEDTVRELMVKVLRGTKPEKLRDSLQGWYYEDISLKYAVEDALDFLQLGISPYR
ncbi:MAG: toll/interleukin-1 receptor domain-containing protein [Promethearchaeota archaeon]|nr:MAG: toll/interleukin-1 receptor domain-containing protein [Candidatus Lokiarchaeota archaeon]